MERVLQFGTGRFLRGFVDAFIEDANASGVGTERAPSPQWRRPVRAGGAARRAGLRYRLLVRGLDAGRIVDTSRVVGVHRPDRRCHARPRRRDRSRRWTRTCAHRLQHDRGRLSDGRLHGPAVGGAGGAGPGRVAGRRRSCPASSSSATATDCGSWSWPMPRAVEPSRAWSSTSGMPTHGPSRSSTASRRCRRQTMPGTAAIPAPSPWSPIASWVVEAPSGVPGCPTHPAVQRTADVLPFALRKIRILNGAHTALVARTRDGPIALRARGDGGRRASPPGSRSCCSRRSCRRSGDRIVDGAGFVRDRAGAASATRSWTTGCADIAVGHAEKLAIRLLPTYHDHVARFGRAAAAPGRAARAGRGRAMRAACSWSRAPSSCRSCREPAAPGPGEALVRIRRVGVCGTDLHAFRGRQPFLELPTHPGPRAGRGGRSRSGAGVTGVPPGDRAAVRPALGCGACDACRRGFENACTDAGRAGRPCRRRHARAICSCPARRCTHPRR